MLPQERGEGAPAASLGRARMVFPGRTEVERDYVDHRCPTCGRDLRVRSAYAGMAVVCKFCGRRFVASSTSPRPVLLPIGGHRALAHPSGRTSPGTQTAGEAGFDVVEYLAARVVEAGERNRRLEAERRALRDRIADLRAELLRRPGRPADAAGQGAG